MAVIAGIYLARYWSPVLACHIAEWTGWTLNLSSTVAYVVIFIIVAMAVHLVAYVVGRLLKAIMLGGVNRFVGALFGIVKWALILSVVINLVSLIDTIVPVKDYPIVKESALYTFFEQLPWRILPGLNVDEYMENFKNFTLTA